jgi:hypothetical protein
MSYAQVLAAGTVEHTKELPMSAAMFALLAIGVFVSLLALTWSFRNSSNKHR